MTWCLTGKWTTALVEEAGEGLFICLRFTYIYFQH